jgi:hypothetical protein
MLGNDQLHMLGNDRLHKLGNDQLHMLGNVIPSAQAIGPSHSAMPARRAARDLRLPWQSHSRCCTWWARPGRNARSATA